MTQVFENTEWTDFLWGDHQRIADTARQAVRQGTDTFAEAFDDFSNEAFYRFYAANAKKREEAQVGTEWAEKLHTCMESVPEFQTLKDFCKGSDWKSGIAATSMIEELIKQVPTPEEPFQDVQDEQDVCDYLEQLLADDTDLTDAQRENLAKSLDEAQQSLDTKEAANNVATDLMDETQVRNAVRAAVADAKSEINDVENVMYGAGCGHGSHTPKRGSISAQKLMQMVKDNPNLKEILKQAGRLRRLAQQKQKAKPRQGTNEITGVLSGNDISRMLPSEAMMLMDPDMELIFARKYQERALLEYELKEKPEEHQGPIVMLLDCSGSMRGARETWAAAVALAFLGVAQDQHRDFALVHFSDTVRKITVFDTKSPTDIEDMLNTIVSCGASGGTNFTEALIEGMKVIQHTGSFKKADIIMISDGECPVSDEFLKDAYHPVKKDLEMSCYMVLLGYGDNSERVKMFSDEVVVLRDALKDEAKMHGLFDKV